jgi:hypothetical protein
MTWRGITVILVVQIAGRATGGIGFPIATRLLELFYPSRILFIQRISNVLLMTSARFQFLDQASCSHWLCCGPGVLYVRRRRCSLIETVTGFSHIQAHRIL